VERDVLLPVEQVQARRSDSGEPLEVGAGRRVEIYPPERSDGAACPEPRRPGGGGPESSASDPAEQVELRKLDGRAIEGGGHHAEPNGRNEAATVCAILPPRSSRLSS
jgi:hypothetical protein